MEAIQAGAGVGAAESRIVETERGVSEGAPSGSAERFSNIDARSSASLKEIVAKMNESLAQLKRGADQLSEILGTERGVSEGAPSGSAERFSDVAERIRENVARVKRGTDNLLEALGRGRSVGAGTAESRIVETERGVSEEAPSGSAERFSDVAERIRENIARVKRGADKLQEALGHGRAVGLAPSGK